jgi:two-component system chemotaxis sensor kinase CheA
MIKSKKNGDLVKELPKDRIDVSIGVLDNFMELSGQITVLRNTLIKSAVILEQRYHGDSEVETVIDSLNEMHKVSSVLQNDIAEMRKVGLEAIYGQLRDLVGDFSKLSNKNINLKIEGDELRVDASLGKVLENSLVHMIQNSIEHGIESPEKRVITGKNAVGTIYLNSFQEGENIIVEFSDDGNGIDLNDIKKKAIEKKIFNEEQLKLMSDQKIFSIILDSGFARTQQTGMGVVKRTLESVGGKISIDSKEGVGSRFVLILPIPRSVLIIKSLMIKSGESIFSIPLDEVAEVVRLEDYKESKILHTVEQSLILRHQEELLPLINLNQVLFRTKHHDKFDEMNIVIVCGDGFKYGIIVDEVIDIEEIVVKKMSKHLKNANCFMGITFRGHGGLALILDLLSIAEKSQIRCGEGVGYSNDKMNKSTQDDVVEFMQFNLRKSKNYAFPLELVSRLEEISTSEVEVCGAIPLMRYRNEVLPLLFIERQLNLCSVEENLLEIYPQQLNVIVVNLRNKRFGIVVDEILDIGTTSEQLNTVNRDRMGFLGTIFIGEKTMTVVDVDFLISTYIKFEEEVTEKEFSGFHSEVLWHEDEAA